MALLTKWLGTDLWGAIQTKNDNLIDAVNEFGGGTIGQRLVKSGSTDFDVEYANPELKQLSTTSINLSTLSVGSGFIIDVPNCTYDVKSNIRLKCYSASTPTNYIIGLVYGVSGSLTVSIIIEIISGTATVNDWVIVPYNYELSNDDSYGTLTFGSTTNDVFSNIDAGGLSGVSGIEFQVQASKISKQVTINGGFGIFNSTQTLTNKKIEAYIDLQSKYQHANQIGELSSINGIFPITGVVYTTSTTTINQILSGFAYFDTQNQLILQLNGNNTIASNTDIYFYFNISYVASNYSI
jgi:hypothetical protein